MLESIYIENFAIIDQLQIDFHDQMTVLTGETGAGKSIIIDAIGQLCGNRSQTSFIKSDAKSFILLSDLSCNFQPLTSFRIAFLALLLIAGRKLVKYFPYLFLARLGRNVYPKKSKEVFS